MSDKRLSVLLVTEGTYPYVGGGVSTWCDILCNELPDIDFHLIAVTGSPIATLKYQLPPNVTYLRQIPLWGSEQPSEYVVPNRKFADVYMLQKQTTESVIEELFIPYFEEFLRGIFDEHNTERNGSLLVHAMYRFFQRHDYKATFQSSGVWKIFKKIIFEICESGQLAPNESPSTFDLITALRWLYNFLLPLSLPLPRTDVAHATIASISSLASVVAKIEYDIPLIITDHGIYIRERYLAISSGKFSPFPKKFLLLLSAFATKIIYRNADQISPVCNYNQRWELRWGGDDIRMKTIYNGIDPSLFIPKDKPEKTRSRPTVVAAARVFPLKDIETMIRACAVARESISNVHFIVYGPTDVDIPYSQKCFKLLSDLQLENNFTFGGFHSKPHELYTEGDISILSSISEGFPYTVIESMACGRPVVGTDVGGVSEALEGFGVITKPRDAEALGKGVVTLLNNNELRMRLGSLAREEVLLKFKTSTSVNSYLESYRTLAVSSIPGN